MDELILNGNNHSLSADHQHFFKQALDSLVSNIAVVDETGLIVATNTAWDDFAQTNNADIAHAGIGVNYLDVCKKSAEQGDVAARQVVEHINDILSGRKQKLSFEYPCDSPSQKRWFKCNIAPLFYADKLYAVIAHENITSVRRFRFEIQQLEELFHNLFEYVLEPIIMTNHQGVISLANAAAEQSFGWSKEELSGRHIYELIPEDNWLANPLLKDAFDNKQMFRAMHNEFPTLWAMNRSAERFPVEISFNPLDTEDRQIIAVTIRDISDRLNLENQLRRSQKMDSIGRLVSGVAHDYNNMLGVIMGYAELLEMQVQDQASLKNYAQQIYLAGERGRHLTRKILAVSRSHISEDVNAININELLNDEQAIIEKTLTPRIKLEFILEDELWSIKINKNDLENAILNMAINAMHAMTGQGKLTIKTLNVVVAPGVNEITNLDAGEYVQLSLTDTGFGMDRKTIEKIFEPFYSTKGEQGTGLGLSQVYKLLDDAGGLIKVVSEVNCGTRFDLYFPRFKDIPAQAEQMERGDKQIENVSGNETILVVDDEESLQIMMSEFLSSVGYNVLCAGNAKDALDIIAQDKIDLVISDIIMPGMDGCELSAVIEKEYPEIKLLLVSGYVSHQNIGLISDGVRDNIMSKPYTVQVMLNKVRTMLDSAASSVN